MTEELNSLESNVINKSNLDLFLDKLGKLSEIDEIIDLITSHYQPDKISKMEIEVNEFRENLISFFNISLLSSLYSSFKSLPNLSLKNLPEFLKIINSPTTENVLLVIDQKFSGDQETFWSRVESEFNSFLVPLRALKK